MTKRPETTAYNPRENHFLKNSGDTKNNSVSDNKTDKVGDTKTQNNFVSLKPDFIKPRQPEIPYTRTVSLETPKAETNGILPKKDAVKAEEVNVEEIKNEERPVTETLRAVSYTHLLTANNIPPVSAAVFKSFFTIICPFRYLWVYYTTIF